MSRPKSPPPADLAAIRERCATAMGTLQLQGVVEPRAALWRDLVRDCRTLCLEVERLREERAGLESGGARTDVILGALDALARRLVHNADPHYPLLFAGWADGKPQHVPLSSSEDAPAALRRVLGL